MQTKSRNIEKAHFRIRGTLNTFSWTDSMLLLEEGNSGSFAPEVICLLALVDELIVVVDGELLGWSGRTYIYNLTSLSINKYNKTFNVIFANALFWSWPNPKCRCTSVSIWSERKILFIILSYNIMKSKLILQLFTMVNR